MTATEDQVARCPKGANKLTAPMVAVVSALLWTAAAPAQTNLGPRPTERLECDGGSRILLNDFVLSRSRKTTSLIIQGKSVYTYDNAAKQLILILEGVDPANIDFKDNLSDDAPSGYTRVFLNRDNMRLLLRYEERTGRAEETWGVCKAS